MATTSPDSVLVAKSLIQKGTAGSVVGIDRTSTRWRSIPKSQVKTGAFVDPSTLAGKVALTDIYPNQQITAPDFGIDQSAPSGARATQRAVIVSLDRRRRSAVRSRRQPRRRLGLVRQTEGRTRPVVRLYQTIRYSLGLSGATSPSGRRRSQAGVLISASQNGRCGSSCARRSARIVEERRQITANDLEGSVTEMTETLTASSSSLAEHADPPLVESALQTRCPVDDRRIRRATSTTGARPRAARRRRRRRLLDATTTASPTWSTAS